MAMWTVWMASCYRETSQQCTHRVVTYMVSKIAAKQQLRDWGWRCHGGPGDNPYWVCPACAHDEDRD